MKPFEYDNIKYYTCDEVYPPAEDTFLLIDNLNVKDTDNILEIGVGTGIVSIIASLTGEKVTCVDINPNAIECTKKNVKLNNRDNITVLSSNLFFSIPITP